VSRALRDASGARARRAPDAWPGVPAPAARVAFSCPAPADAAEFLRAADASRGRFAGFADVPLDPRAYRAWCQRARSPRAAGFLLRLRDRGQLVGALGLNRIEPAPLPRATLSCYGFAATAGRGLVSEGVQQLVAWAAAALGLREIAADARPENAASLALLRRCGFEPLEAPARLLRVGGAWHLHERWQLRAGNGPQPGSWGSA